MYILFSKENQFVCNDSNIDGIIESIRNIANSISIKLIFISETTIELEVELSDQVQPILYTLKKV